MARATNRSMVFWATVIPSGPKWYPRKSEPRRAPPVPLGPRRAWLDGLAAATGGRVTPLPQPRVHPEPSEDGRGTGQLARRRRGCREGEEGLSLDVPLVLDTGVGYNWDEAH